MIGGESRLPGLPLDFGEAGFAAKFVNGERITRLLMEPGESNLHMEDLGPGMRLGDVCIYAAYVAEGLHTLVTFSFNGITAIASHEQIEAPEDEAERAEIIDRLPLLVAQEISVMHENYVLAVLQHVP